MEKKTSIFRASSQTGRPTSETRTARTAPAEQGPLCHQRADTRPRGTPRRCNVEQGVYPLQKALRIARDQELDLVEISPTANPPVCRVLDYQKFLYQQKKKQKEQKAKATKVVVKEIRFGPQTDDHDYNFKLKHAIGFLQEGSKVKAYVFFRGRSILFKEQGEVLLLRFANDLEEYGKVEMMPVLEGKRMTIMLSPVKPKAPKKEAAPKETATTGQEAETETETE